LKARFDPVEQIVAKIYNFASKAIAPRPLSGRIQILQIFSGYDSWEVFLDEVAWDNFRKAFG